MRLLLAALSGVVALAVAGPAAAEEVVLRDRKGRPIRLDVRASGISPEWYASKLRDAAHADEISRVTIRIVDWRELAETCGRAAAGCYSGRGGRGLVVVPAAETRAVAHTLVHEYGHHVDASRAHGGLTEPNGTPLWWRARGLDELVELQSVARSYRLGWDRSIGELFAEDYAYTNLGGPWRIRWLEPPSATVQAAIRADLGLQAAPAIPARPPSVRPVVLERAGTLWPSASESVSFGLLGPNRRVTFTASLAGPGGAGSRTRLAIECERGTVRARVLAGAQRTATIDLARFGPARCRAVLANTGTSTERFSFTVRLSVRN